VCETGPFAAGADERHVANLIVRPSKLVIAVGRAVALGAVWLPPSAGREILDSILRAQLLSEAIDVNCYGCKSWAQDQW